MKFRTVFMVLLLAFVGSFYSCSNDTEMGRETNEAIRETENAMSNLGAEIREESNEFERNFKEARMNIDRRMERIEADMENASAEAKAEMQEEWNELEAYGKKVDARMDRVGNNMEAGWKDFKGDVNKGWKDFSMESKNLLRDIERDLDPEGDLD